MGRELGRIWEELERRKHDQNTVWKIIFNKKNKKKANSSVKMLKF